MESVGKYSTERKAFDTAYRLRRINALRQLWSLEPIEDFLVSTGSTIGIEIEMTWPQAFPNMSKWDRANIRPWELPRDSDEYEQFSADYDSNDTQMRPLLEQVQSIIPRIGRDAYWEFSFLPTKNSQILVHETSMLYEKSILRDDIPYAMHVTMSDIDNERDAYAMLMMLEMEGGATHERLTSNIGWARKGDGGLRKRTANELLGIDSCAYEFRTLVCLGVEHLQSILSLAQRLSIIRFESPKVWAELRSQLEEKLKQQGLPVSKWDSPTDNPGLWQQYADVFIPQ